MSRRGDFFIVSAPSGGGKTTLIEALMASEMARKGELAVCVSHTTRKPRRGEIPGRDYFFVDRDEFERMVAAGEFLEWAEVYGNLYGTSAREVLPRLEAGVDVIHDLDVQGAERLLATYPGICAIFVLPPSYSDLVQRLSGRRQDEPAAIARRLALSLSEIRRYEKYHYVIINRDAERAGEALAAIVLDKRFRRERMRGEVEAVLADFTAAVGETPQ